MRGGGSVLGVSINHAVVDGGGYLGFLLHWSRTHAGRESRPRRTTAPHSTGSPPTCPRRPTIRSTR